MWVVCGVRSFPVLTVNGPVQSLVLGIGGVMEYVVLSFFWRHMIWAVNKYVPECCPWIHLFLFIDVFYKVQQSWTVRWLLLDDAFDNKKQLQMTKVDVCFLVQIIVLLMLSLYWVRSKNSLMRSIDINRGKLCLKRYQWELNKFCVVWSVT